MGPETSFGLGGDGWLGRVGFRWAMGVALCAHKYNEGRRHLEVLVVNRNFPNCKWIHDENRFAMRSCIIPSCACRVWCCFARYHAHVLKNL